MEKQAKQKKEQPPWAVPSGRFVTGEYTCFFFFVNCATSD